MHFVVSGPLLPGPDSYSAMELLLVKRFIVTFVITRSPADGGNMWWNFVNTCWNFR